MPKKTDPIWPESRLGKADVHIHSIYSDGGASTQEILDYTQHRTDLDVIAISDHDTIEGAKQAQKLMEGKNYRFELIVGEEITSIDGHIIGLFLKEAIPPGLSTQDTLARIRTQGGLAIASHPFYHSKLHHSRYATMDGIGATTLLRNNGFIDAVEIVNGTPTLDDVNLFASILNKTVLFNSEVGNSDAHILDAIGMGYTLFEGRTAQDYRRAILLHQTRAMFKKWSYLGLIKYLFFYFPLGTRLLVHTLTHGRTHRKPDLLEKEIKQES